MNFKKVQNLLMSWVLLFSFVTFAVAGEKSYKTSQTNFAESLKRAETFFNKNLEDKDGVKLSKLFLTPEILPWKKVIVIYLPGGFGNVECFDWAEKIQPEIWNHARGVDYAYATNMSYGDYPRLFLIEQSVSPTAKTMEMTADELSQIPLQFLHLGAYAVADALFHELTGKYLDQGTVTVFPNDRLHGEVATANYYLDKGTGRGWVTTQFELSSTRYLNMGARETIEVPLRDFDIYNRDKINRRRGVKSGY